MLRPFSWRSGSSEKPSSYIIHETAAFPIVAVQTRGGFVSPDGEKVALSAGGRYFLYPIAEGSARAVPVLAAEDIIIR
jgi:hypothetical protein